VTGRVAIFPSQAGRGARRQCHPSTSANSRSNQALHDRGHTDSALHRVFDLRQGGMLEEEVTVTPLSADGRLAIHELLACYCRVIDFNLWD